MGFPLFETIFDLEYKKDIFSLKDRNSVRKTLYSIFL